VVVAVLAEKVHWLLPVKQDLVEQELKFLGFHLLLVRL
jgi:hypothetical protein